MLTTMLLEASGAGNGFFGGPYADEYPYLDLTEATGSIPTMLSEFMNESIDIDAKLSADRLSAIVESASYGSDIDTSFLVETGWETVKRKIREVFERLKKFIKSIIAKITNYIDSVVKSGAQLVSKYKDEITKRASSGAYKDLEFNGYVYISDIQGAFKKGAYSTFESNVHDAVKLGGSGIKSVDEFKKLIDNPNFKTVEDSTEAKEAKKKLEDIESNKLKKAVIENMASEVSSIGSSAGDWKKALMKYLQGGSDKKTIKYGTAPFTVSDLCEYFTNQKDWKDIQNEYEKLKNACDKQERDLDDITATNDNAKEELSSYISTYLNRVSDCWSAMALMRDAKVTATKNRDAQAKAMLGKLVRKGEKKKDNNDVELDEILDFDFE